MPYFEVKTNVSMDAEKKETVMHAMAKIIELIPGKSENWVMVNIEDDVFTSFSGKSEENAAMITVKTFGELEDSQYAMLTDEICNKVNELLDIDTKRIYIVYEPIKHWGWDHTNF